ncbi:hypothetical protein E1295_36155 [Nonomuraea mesophila]|uniref:CU044_5270 family protein n=1 Tax=Nonomuraea mesophila TaxID=2530382 RepID=A0A4R5ELD4_9ACTN|nr:CU044_5270 family protein [Nonomuraea mesophila]TDE35368.1 hypothetical protein E1295_36155 [Nonomuraea mesophila]
MNELEALKSHHDSLPGPSPEVTARARGLLAEEAEAERAGEGHGQPVWPPRRVPGGLPGRRLAIKAGVAVGLAAAVTAGVSVVRGGQNSASFGTPPANAAELLQNAASVAAREEAPGPGQFVYIDWRIVTFATGSEGDYTQDVRREVWMPAGDPGKALTRSTYGQVHVVSGGRPVHPPSPGAVEYQRAGQCHERSLALPFQATDLLADPDRALAKIREDAKTFVRADQRRRGETELGTREIDMRVEKVIASSLHELAQDPLTSSEARAAVFRTLSKLPTVTIVPNLTDPAGRRGVGASLKLDTPDGWERGELIFEPVTYRFLGHQSWLGRQEGGQVKEVRTGSMAVMAVEIVDSMPEVPKDAGKPTLC